MPITAQRPRGNVQFLPPRDKSLQAAKHPKSAMARDQEQLAGRINPMKSIKSRLYVMLHTRLMLWPTLYNGCVPPRRNDLHDLMCARWISGKKRPHCRRSERRVRHPKPAVHSFHPTAKPGPSAEEVIREIKRLFKIEKNPPTVTRAEGRLTRRGGFLKSTASSPTTITAHDGCGSL